MFGTPAIKARAADEGLRKALGSTGIFFERHQVSAIGTYGYTQIVNPVVNCERCVDITVDGITNRLHFTIENTAIVAGQQHAPFHERYIEQVMHLDFDGQFR